MFTLDKKSSVKLSVFALVLLVPILLMMFDLQLLLRYHALNSLNHEYWRLISGHWVHLTWGHLWLNLAAFLILLYSFYDLLSLRHSLILYLALCLLTTLAFILFSPELRWYVGLSGILHGIFIYLVLLDHKLNKLFKGLFIAGLATKLAWEQINGALPSSEKMAGGNVVVDAHLYGAIAGLICAIFYFLWQNYLRKSA